LLLVEDEAAVRSFEGRVLSDAGYRVAEAATAEEAVALIEEGPPPALLITDVLLPTASGPELADLVRARLPGLPVLFVSGYDGDRLSSDGRVGPGTPFLSKPFAAEALLGAVRSAIDARTPPGD
jgi:CheY-like chemotaxis protein